MFVLMRSIYQYHVNLVKVLGGWVSSRGTGLQWLMMTSHAVGYVSSGDDQLSWSILQSAGFPHVRVPLTVSFQFHVENRPLVSGPGI